MGVIRPALVLTAMLMSTLLCWRTKVSIQAELHSFTCKAGGRKGRAASGWRCFAQHPKAPPWPAHLLQGGGGGLDDKIVNREFVVALACWAATVFPRTT